MIWRELMSGSLYLEQPLRIGFLGPKGSFSHNAAILKSGQSVEYEALADIRAIFEEVSKGHCHFGIVPIENSAGGGVRESLDAFIGNGCDGLCGSAYGHSSQPDGELSAVGNHQNLLPAGGFRSRRRNWLAATFKVAKTIPVASSSRAGGFALEEPGAALSLCRC